MKRLIPKTLFWRLICVLFVGLTLALAASMLINYKDRDRLLSSTARTQSAQRIADTVVILDSLDTEEQKRIINLINIPPQQVWLSEAPLSSNEQSATNSQATEFAAQILSQISQAQATDATVQATEISVRRTIRVTQAITATDIPPQNPPMVSPRSGMGRHRMEGRDGVSSMGMRHGMQPGHVNTTPVNSPNGSFFLVQIELANGSWVIFDIYTPQTTVFFHYGFFCPC